MILNEGLIKVPENLFHDTMSAISKDVFWMLRDKPDIKKKYPAHYKAVMAEVKKQGIVLPKEKFKVPENGFKIVPYPLKLNLPKNYSKLSPDRENYYVILDYGYLEKSGSNTAAYYWNRTRKTDGKKEAAIVVHINRIRGLKDFPAHRTPEEVPYILSSIKSTIEHELRHLVQHVLLEPVDKKQVETLPNYKNHGTDYYASQVEYDPQIGSAVEVFLEYWSLVSNNFKNGSMREKPNLTKLIKQFVGAIPGSSYNGLSCDEFFSALKKKDKELYRKAIKKFIVEITRKLSNQ